MPEGVAGDDQPFPSQDPILRLAVALQHGKGAYALLLGSGVSRSSGIPTGWEIVLNLVRQLAASSGEHWEPGHEVAWYVDTFGAEPAYDTLLDQVTGFKVERSQLLAGYIEPTAEDLTDGKKVPKEAHHAIARLVSAGYIRIIITTNFDQLLEEALRAVNIVPRVIATAEAVEQALPLVHQPCTIIKVHGDYTSGELKNTTEELAAYDERLNHLLERVFSDFGLIICGWSAEWDHALRAVVSENASRAYSMFWAVRGDMRNAGAGVMAAREGKAVIHIDNADSFFQILEEKTHAIQRILQSPTLTADVARATVERYLEDPYANRIRIRNLVMTEIQHAVEWLDNHVYLSSTPPSPEQIRAELSELVTALQPVLAMFIIVGRWGEREQHNTLIEALERVMDASRGRDFNLRWAGYWAYTTYLLLYAGGIAAVSGDRYEMLYALLTDPTTEQIDARQRRSLTWALGTESYIRFGEEIRPIRTNPRDYTPLSDQLHDDLIQQFRNLIPDEARYEEDFDRFEYLVALIYRDIAQQQGDNGQWAPIGCFSWRAIYGPEYSIMAQIGREIDARQGSWLPLRAGFFGGDLERLNEVRGKLDEFITKVQQQQRW